MKLFFPNCKIIVLNTALLFTSFLNAQINCGDKAVQTIQKSNTLHFDELEKHNNLVIKNYIEANLSQSSNNKAMAANYVIPVVFHIVHPVGQAYGTGSNISYLQIKSQIDALNAAFSKSYPTYNGQTHPTYAQNTNIQFCLASIAAPTAPGFYVGGAGVENGVMRYSDNVLTNHLITNASATALLGLTHPTASYFPFNNYLNIWVVATINGASGVMGYAPKPLMGVYPLDGVIMRSDIIGDNTTGNTFVLGFGLTQGKILSHEVGHYLNLYHIFQGGCAGANAAGSATDACDLNGDMICDIEPCTTQNFNCTNPIPNTCAATYTTGTTNLDMINDYMSYADDDCMNTFTNNQSQRMAATLNTLRANLWSPGNLAATGVVGAGGCLSPFLISTIKVNPSSVCTSSNVIVSNPLPGNTATSWTWTFVGANITTANTSSVSITYSVPGLFWTKLSVSNGTLTIKDSVQIAATSCSLDSTKLNQSNWYFGKFASLGFKTGAPVSQNPSSINAAEPAAAISDSLGNLLFYTDGDYAWNKNHVQMSNLGGLLRGALYGKSASQGALIVPFPFDKKKYYLFSGTQQPVFAGDSSKQLKYSVIDMNLNGGLGEISIINQTMPGQYFLSTEGLTAIPHCNGYDYWVIIRTAKTSGYKDKIAAYLITGNGISNPVMSNAGYSIPFNAADGNEYLSAIEASPDCKLVSITCNISTATGKRLYMYKFNNSSGVFTSLNNYLVGPSGVGFLLAQEFSPDSKKLYLDNDFDMYQVDLTVPTSPTLAIVGNQTFAYGGVGFQTGPDNKIYFSEYNQTKLGVINFPNMAGAACSLNMTGPALLAGQQNLEALPNFIDAKKPKGISVSFISTPINCTTNKFSVDTCWKFYNVNWTFGDGANGIGLSINHTYTASGTYSVTMQLSIGTFSFPVVSQNVTIIPAPPIISGPSVICKGSPFINIYGVAAAAGATYTWSAGNASVAGPNNLSTANILALGIGTATVSVQVINGACITSATKTITIDTIPNVNFVTTPTVCIGNNITLTATPVGGTFSGPGVTGNIFNSATAGAGNQLVNYSYTNANGCYKNSTSNISVISCVGVNEINKAPISFQIFPNPSNGEFEIKGMSEETILITNELGQVIQTRALNTQNNFTVKVGDLQSGIYFVGNKNVNQKIVVIK